MLGGLDQSSYSILIHVVVSVATVTVVIASTAVTSVIFSPVFIASERDRECDSLEETQ